jgi:hypothetical protein
MSVASLAVGRTASEEVQACRPAGRHGDEAGCQDDDSHSDGTLMNSTHRHGTADTNTLPRTRPNDPAPAGTPEKMARALSMNQDRSAIEKCTEKQIRVQCDVDHRRVEHHYELASGDDG